MKIRKPLSLSYFFVALLLLANGTSAGVRHDFARQIQERIELLRGEAGFPGATVGIAFEDGTTVEVSVGSADVESGTALKPRDRMLAGSIGKTFVAATALQLIEEGKLNLDDLAGKWLGSESWFKRLPNAATLTVRHLMRHTSGIKEHVLDPAFLSSLKSDRYRNWTRDLLAFTLDKTPGFPVGEGWDYADTSYIVVGMIVERATGRALYEEVRRRFLIPLRLERTIPSDNPRIPELITGYARPGNPFGEAGRVIIDKKFVVNPQFEWAGGGFASTALDLASGRSCFMGAPCSNRRRSRLRWIQSLLERVGVTGTVSGTGAPEPLGRYSRPRRLVPRVSFGNGILP